MFLNWSINNRVSPLSPGPHFLAPVVTWFLGAHMGRGWQPRQDQVWIRKLFLIFEAGQRKQQVHAEHRFWAQSVSLGVQGRPVPQVSDAQ